MKTIKFILLMLFAQATWGQITIGGQYNLDVYKPYTLEAQSYMKVNDKVHSHTQSAYVLIKAIKRNKLSWQAGLSYKHIFHEVEDKIKTYYWLSYGNGVTTPTVYVQEKNDLDLWSKSHSLGIINEVSMTFKEKEKISHELGFTNEIYFLEFFHSAYYFKGEEAEHSSIGAYFYPLNPKLGTLFLFSSTNFSAFYRFRLKSSEKFSVSGKVSLGTNLYSDWDQFRKYAWVGVGLEMGFGKLKMFKHKK